MLKIIEIEVRSVYGNNLIYPHNAAANALAKLIGKKTFSFSDIKNACELGLEVVEVSHNYLAIGEMAEEA